MTCREAGHPFWPCDKSPTGEAGLAGGGGRSRGGFAADRMDRKETDPEKVRRLSLLSAGRLMRRVPIPAGIRYERRGRLLGRGMDRTVCFYVC